MRPAWIVLVLNLCSACSAFDGAGRIEPWVKPYERQYLAEPIMSFTRAGIAEGYSNHVHQAREGARGAEGGAGGGCGCN